MIIFRKEFVMAILCFLFFTNNAMDVKNVESDTKAIEVKKYARDQSSCRIKNGSNYWGDSNIRTWLNSDKKVVEYPDGNPPSYVAEAGFLTNFSTEEQKVIKQVAITTFLHHYDKNIEGVSDITYDKFFLLDNGFQEDNFGAEHSYLLRTPYYYGNVSVLGWGAVKTDIEYYNKLRYYDIFSNDSDGIYPNEKFGISPAFYLNTESLKIKGEGSELVPYKIADDDGDVIIKEGDFLEFGSYNGVKILWKCIRVDNDGPLFLSAENLCDKEFDAAGDNLISIDGKRNSHDRNIREVFGTNYWKDSDIRLWLNSADKEFGSNFTSALYNESGFLHNFTEKELSAIKLINNECLVSELDSTLPGVIGNKSYETYGMIGEIEADYENCFKEYVEDRVFLLDVKQVCTIYKNLGEYAISSDYLLRTPEIDGVQLYIIAEVNGRDRGKYEKGLNVALANDIHNIRPAFYLNTQNISFSSGNGDKKSPYIIGEGSGANIKIGEYLKMGKYKNRKIVWRCVATDENGALMFADRDIAKKPF